MVTLKELKKVDADAVLGALGVQRKRTGAWVGPAVGGLFLGAVVGMASALFLLLPESTQKLRGALLGTNGQATDLSAVPDVETA
jgi:hypothetical protein